MSTPKRSVIVTRDYRPAPDNCAHALELLLKKSVRKNPAAGPSERGKHDGTIKEDSADGSIIRD
jgi:hypothetical protein